MFFGVKSHEFLTINLSSTIRSRCCSDRDLCKECDNTRFLLIVHMIEEVLRFCSYGYHCVGAIGFCGFDGYIQVVVYSIKAIECTMSCG